MKILFLSIVLIYGITITAQEGTEQEHSFVRVYDLKGKKISKGFILSITDTSLHLNRNKVAVNIPVNNIGSIKTRRSAGNNILFSAVIGASAAAILGVATSSSDPEGFEHSAGEGAVIGVIAGATTGAVVGGIAILLKNSKTYEIKGNEALWMAFKESVTVPNK
jgi:hypothetical protein